MSRPAEPQKKQVLLQQCLAAAIADGALDTGINSIAKKIGTSGRMLIYHFGSKQEFEQQLIGLLEIHLREKLWSFTSSSIGKASNVSESLLAMWQHLTSPEMQSLLKLSMELNQRAIQGDQETRHFLESESQQWIESLSHLTGSQIEALSLFHLFQGAILDFLTTGNAHRGRQTIETFAQALD
ncbi:MAG: TetR/AcrR family transcriptional regulator [Cyanobacteria bacterium P01_H01_bin.58]